MIFWEWRHKDPIIDLHLFRDRTFGVSNLLMFMLGFALLGSTLLLPLFIANAARIHGRAGGAGADAGRLHHHSVAATGRVFAFALHVRDGCCYSASSCSPFSLFHMTGFDLANGFPHRWPRRACSRPLGMAFLFVPINTAAYAFLPRDKNNAASGLMNLARNIGGSVGISVVTTMLDRRTQVHLNDLAGHLTPATRFPVDVQGASRAMQAHGASAA